MCKQDAFTIARSPSYTSGWFKNTLHKALWHLRVCWICLDLHIILIIFCSGEVLTSARRCHTVFVAEDEHLGLALVGWNSAVPFDEFLHHSARHLDTFRHTGWAQSEIHSVRFTKHWWLSYTQPLYAIEWPKDKGATSKRSMFSTSSVPGRVCG